MSLPLVLSNISNLMCEGTLTSQIAIPPTSAYFTLLKESEVN